jgi:hypothetical protein
VGLLARKLCSLLFFQPIIAESNAFDEAITSSKNIVLALDNNGQNWYV